MKTGLLVGVSVGEVLVVIVIVAEGLKEVVPLTVTVRLGVFEPLDVVVGVLDILGVTDGVGDGGIPKNI